jgi:hypothetical protein
VKIALVALCIFLIPVGTSSQGRRVEITSPADGGVAPSRLLVQGTSSDSSASVWLIVHPLEMSDYWVQPRVSVQEKGRWAVSAYIGRPGGEDAGKQFELLAVANPKDPLKEGEVLENWPEAEARSQVVIVTRK